MNKFKGKIKRGGKSLVIREKEQEKQIIDRKNTQNIQKEQKKEPETSEPKDKRLMIIAVLGATALSCWYFIDYLDYYFLSLLRLAIACFEQDLPEYGILLIIIQSIAWIVFSIFFYFGVFNMVFPRIRGVNAMRTKNTWARKVIQIEGPDPKYVYLKVKFTFFPFFDWYTMKIPKPTHFKNIRWRRMPQSVDIQSNDINLIYNDQENLYEVTGEKMERITDSQQFYKDKASKVIRYIGENVGNAIQGDSNMMKDYYTMNLVMDEHNEPIPKNRLQRPPSELEKEVDKKEEIENDR